jgi:branched-subunit amino acid transport protein
MMLAAVVVLALGTYGFRLSGILLRGRLVVPAAVQRLLSSVATTLIVALAVQSTVTDSSGASGFSGFARLIGVAVGAVLAWRGASFMVVVAVATAVTALLRLAGVA